MLTKIVVPLGAEDEIRDTLAQEVSEAFLDLAPSFTADVQNAKDSGFRSMNVHYNVITKKFDVSIFFVENKRLFYHTTSAACPIDAIAILARAIVNTKLRQGMAKEGNLRNIEFHYTVETDDEYGEESVSPF